MQKLTIQEEKVMIHIWEMESCLVKDIVARIGPTAPPYTTIASIVKNLERKGYVSPLRIGKTYQYSPNILKSEYKRNFMHKVVHHYFDSSYKEIVSFFAKEQKISTEELKDIIRMIESGKED